MREPRKTSTAFVINDVNTTKIEQVQGQLDVTKDGSSANDTGPFRSYQSNASFDIAPVVFVRKLQFSNFAVGNREREPLTRRGGPVTGPLRRDGGALESQLLSPREFRRRHCHTGTDLTGRGHWGECWLGHTSRLSLDET